MKQEHMEAIVNYIDEALMNAENDHTLERLAKQVNDFMNQFPLYPELG
jgi:glycine hydroxymethyltransferase